MFQRGTSADTDDPAGSDHLPVTRRVTLASLLGFGLGLVGRRDTARAAPASVKTEVQKLTASDGDESDRFGSAVALDDDTAIVGAENDDVDGLRDSGSGYVFEQSASGWPATETRKLTASVSKKDDHFGWAVALDGTTVVVGAPGNRTDDFEPHYPGTAYVFERTGGSWPETETQVLTASDGAENDGFGDSVALDGDTALVGADLDDVDDVFNAGSVYVFERTGGSWPATETQKLTASDGGLTDNFGGAVALDGDTALVGAPLRGAAYVFERTADGWPATETQKLPSSVSAGHFGDSVALDGDTALVGAPLLGGDEGAAFVYQRDGDGHWAETASLRPSDPQGDQFFGWSVALVGTTALISAPARNVGEGFDNDRGAVFVFERTADGWPATETETLLASDRTEDGNRSFGGDVAFDGNTALVGASVYGDETGTPTGASYLFEVNAPPTAIPDEATVDQGESVAVDVLDNDSDPDGTLDPTSVTITGTPASGVVSVDTSTGIVTYTHDGSETTTDEFAYRVADDSGAQSNEARVSIEINLQPTADFDFSPSTPEVDKPVTFDGSASEDPDGVIATWEWNFDDDGLFETSGETVTHVFESAGEPSVELRVTDNDGAVDTVTKTLVVKVFADPLDVPVGNTTRSIGPPQDRDGDGLFEDVDGDGDLDGRDVAALTKIIDAYRRGEIELTEAQIEALDFNGDGDLDQKDISALARMLDEG